MTLVGQPPASPVLHQGLDLLSKGSSADAENAVRKAAVEARSKHGSGSHPLALAYADMARLHFRMGELERAAKEFSHAADGPMPSDPQQRRDRLSFLFGYGAALGELGKYDEAEKVLRRCVGYARNLMGSSSACSCVALIPLADVYLSIGKGDEAAKLANQAYDALWKLGDPLFSSAVGTRAETLKAIGRAGNPFADLAALPEDMVTQAIAFTLDRAGRGDAGRVRAVLADVLAFVEKQYGDGHSITSDALAAVAHHETAMGERGDETIRRTAIRRFVWSFAVRRVPGGLLANLEVAFEPDGGVHLVPHLTRDATPEETAQVETVLNQAVDDLYSRPILRPLGV
ncbi:MAG TPA: tetratricopeptide repeat protein [Gemmata sp.]|nr:tetratricopeptide repeat protein [Gemmata sp.]